MHNFFHSDFFTGLLGWFLLVVVTLPLAPYVFANSQRRRRHRNGFLAANIGEGTREFDSLVPDVNIPARFLLAKRGSSTLNFALPTALADRPIGVCEDQSSVEAIGTTPGLPLRISRLGLATRTKKVAINTSVAQDDTLVSDGAGYAKTLPTNAGAGTFWVIGQADQAGAASGDASFPTVIEFIPILPYKVTV